MVRLIWILAVLLFVPSVVSAQTVRSHTLDAAGNSITSGTSAPAGTERGLHTRQVGEVDVNCLTGCASATDEAGTEVTLNVEDETATVALAGRSGAVVHFDAGNLDGTVLAEVSLDGGTTWVAASFGDPATGLTVASLDFDGSDAALDRVILFPGSITHARVRLNPVTGGSVDATLRATTVNTVSIVYGTEVAGGGLQALPFMSSTPAGTEMAPVFRCIGCTSTGGTNAADNTVWVYGTTAVTPAGFVYDTTPTAPTDGRVGVARMNVNRDAQVTITGPDGTGVVEDTNGVLVSLTTVASTQGYNRRVSSAIESGLAMSIDGNGAGTVAWEIDGACTCTIVFEATIDPGGSPTYFAVPAIRQDNGHTVTSITNPTGAMRGYFKQVGFRKFQVRVSAHTSGTPNLRLELSNGNSGIHPTRIECSRSAVVNTATGTTPVQFAEVGGSGVGGTTGEHVYICGIDVSSDGTTTVDVIQGTSSACADPVALSATHRLTAQTGWTRDSEQAIYRTTSSGRFICLRTGSNVQTDATIRYEQF